MIEYWQYINNKHIRKVPFMPRWCPYQSQNNLMQLVMNIYIQATITMASWWARWRLKSHASQLFTQPFVQGVDPRKHQSSASLAFVGGIHQWTLNSPHKGSVTRKTFPFDDVIMTCAQCRLSQRNRFKLRNMETMMEKYFCIVPWQWIKHFLV